MSTSIDRSARATVRPQRARHSRATHRLLACGVVAGPVYVSVSLGQAVAHHPAFDPTRHAWSLLAAGPWGWVQMLNLGVTGALVVGLAAGLARSTSSRWAPTLITCFGIGMVAAGLMVADPMHGYPVGVPMPDAPTWHGIGHMVAGSTGFLAMVAAALVLGRAYARAGRSGYAWWARFTGVSFAAAIVAIGSGSASPVLVLGFTTAVVAVFALLAGVAVDHLRTPE